MKEASDKKYSLEISEKEVEELRNSIKASSIRLMDEYIERMKKAWPNRPHAMQYFDDIAKFFGTREDEIREAKEEGRKVIGYTCMFAPIELILAADAIPVRVSSGLYDTVKLGNRIVPVEVCPLVRSTIGLKMIGLSPYLELSDALIVSLTCDEMTKLSEILSDYKPVWTLCPPPLKDSERSMRFWREELRIVKEKIEKLTGTKITVKRLRDAIKVMHGAVRAFRKLQELRMEAPVIMGRDAMLVNQTSMWDDIERWTWKTEELCNELEMRKHKKIWACPPDTPRIMIAGTPTLWPDNWKLLNIIEEASPQGVIVADELCSGDRILFDPVGVDEWTMDDVLNAIAERYLLPSTCPCFTSENGNEDRVNWLKARIEERRVDGVIYHVFRGCMLYAMEYMRIKKVLDKINVPIYYLDTDYTREDVGQIKTRVEAFLEMLKSRVEF